MIKKERFDREHEDILREIRHGLLRYGGGGGGGKAPSRNNADETYMYDDDMLRHWYDEPPYESDPEELLMEHANNRCVDDGFVVVVRRTDEPPRIYRIEQCDVCESSTDKSDPFDYNRCLNNEFLVFRHRSKTIYRSENVMVLRVLRFYFTRVDDFRRFTSVRKSTNKICRSDENIIAKR